MVAGPEMVGSDLGAVAPQAQTIEIVEAGAYLIVCDPHDTHAYVYLGITNPFPRRRQRDIHRVGWYLHLHQ